MCWSIIFKIKIRILSEVFSPDHRPIWNYSNEPILLSNTSKLHLNLELESILHLHLKCRQKYSLRNRNNPLTTFLVSTLVEEPWFVLHCLWAKKPPPRTFAPFHETTMKTVQLSVSRNYFTNKRNILSLDLTFFMYSRVYGPYPIQSCFLLGHPWIQEKKINRHLESEPKRKLLQIKVNIKYNILTKEKIDLSPQKA